VKCVIRRRGLYLNLPALWYIHGTWTPELQLARVFHSQREAIAYMSGSDLPRGEWEIVPVIKVAIDTGLAVQLARGNGDRPKVPTLELAEPVEADTESDRGAGKKRPKPWQRPRR
jgi:hypothetical protein